MIQPMPRRISLIGQTADFLRQALDQGDFGSSLPGERKLAELLHVSRPTVRAALEMLVREGRIQGAPGKSRQITQARSGCGAAGKRRVLVLTPLALDQLPGFFRLTLDHLRARLADEDIPLDLRVDPVAFSARPSRRLEELVSRCPNAIWLLHLSAGPAQQWFFERKIPCLLAGTPVAGVALPGVDQDYRAVCRHAASTLLQIGRRQLAILLPEGLRGGEKESEQGFLEAFSSPSFKAFAPLVMRHDMTAAGVCQALDRTRNRTPGVDGVVVGRSIHTLTVLTHLLRLGVKVPGDIAVISRDDDAFLGHMVPSVARYVTGPSRFAAALLKVILAIGLGRRPVPFSRTMIPELVWGDTLPRVDGLKKSR
jgi:DNA-binding LacI/PurR family transcriptional regulator